MFVGIWMPEYYKKNVKLFDPRLRKCMKKNIDFKKNILICICIHIWAANMGGFHWDIQRIQNTVVFIYKRSKAL